jgi:peptidoglycan-associated lipoprotein
MKALKMLPILLAGPVLVVGLACKKPEPLAKTAEPAKADTTASDRSKSDAEARLRAADEARRKAELDAQKAEEARRAADEAFRKAADQALVDIHFDLDKSTIKEADKVVLQDIAAFMAKYPKVRIQVEGNADERGTVEYNLALGAQRADAAITYLGALGIPSGRFVSISYGKEKPVCTEADESCWHRNRRDHFALKN